jgi:hypothetical protein
MKSSTCRAHLNGLASSFVKYGAVIRHRLHCFRALVAGVALLTAAGPLLDAMHLAAVRHVTCPEDGELIEASLDHTGDAAHEDGATGVIFAERHGTGTLRAAHDHCAVALQARAGSRASAHRAAVRTAAAVTRNEVPPQLLVLRTLAIYRLAPKASPPAA